MGWYTSNSDDTFQYKFGDLVGLARESGLGRLSLAIRLEGEDDDGEPIDEEPFLGPLQSLSAARGRPFNPAILFNLNDDPTGESLAVPNDVVVWPLMEQWAEIILANRSAVIAAMQASCEDDELTVATLILGAEPAWNLDPRDHAAFVAWLNDPLPKQDHLSLNDLASGSLQDGGYVSSPAVTRVQPHLHGDDARILGLQALGHTLVESGESAPLSLFQPDDDYTAIIWTQDDGPLLPLEQ